VPAIRDLLVNGLLAWPVVSPRWRCVVAAGAVVTGDCEPDGLYAGVPARRVRDLT
jgi:acetyltransferase-like isoleucine patch superfamily enzyme